MVSSLLVALFVVALVLLCDSPLLHSRKWEAGVQGELSPVGLRSHLALWVSLRHHPPSSFFNHCFGVGGSPGYCWVQKVKE